MGFFQMLKDFVSSEEETDFDYLDKQEREYYGLTDQEEEMRKESGLTPGEWKRAWRNADSDEEERDE